jgi:hypothetical protein
MTVLSIAFVTTNRKRYVRKKEKAFGISPKDFLA